MSKIEYCGNDLAYVNNRLVEIFSGEEMDVEWDGIAFRSPKLPKSLADSIRYREMDRMIAQARYELLSQLSPKYYQTWLDAKLDEEPSDVVDAYKNACDVNSKALLEEKEKYNKAREEEIDFKMSIIKKLEGEKEEMPNG